MRAKCLPTSEDGVQPDREPILEDVRSIRERLWRMYGLPPGYLRVAGR